MNILKMALMAGVVMTSAYSANAQSSDEIITKHVAAVGGDLYAKVKSVKMDMKVSTAQMDIDMTIAMIPGKAGMQKMSMMGQEVVMAVTPTTGWVDAGGKLTDLSGDDHKQAIEQMQNLEFADDLVDAKNKKYAIVMGGKEAVNGKDAYKLIVTDADGDDHNYFVDAANYYIVKQSQMVNVEGQQMEQSITFSDFKKQANGITLAMSQDLGEGGMIKVKKIEFDTIADEKAFAKPTK